jgi:ABC-type ATPase with predicted acetyltransferase domain
MNINLINHNDTAWVRDVEITYEGKTYLIKFGWEENYGYEIRQGWSDLPESLRNQYESQYDFVSELDEATYAKAYNKEEVNECDECGECHDHESEIMTIKEEANV